MTQRANPSVNRPVEAFKSAGAIALAGGTENGWISPADTPSDISIQDRAILDEDLNAFDESSQADSLDVTIDPGEAFVFGSWIVKDKNTVISLAPSTNNQTIYVGWNNNEANDIIVGTNDEFNNGPNDTDQRIPLYDYDTDSNGVTSVTDRRQIGKVIETSKVDILEELGLPSYSNPANAPQEPANAVYVDGSGSDLAGIYIHRDGSYKRVRDTQDEIEDYVDSLLTSSGGITLSYDDDAGSLNIDGATQYVDADARDAVLPQILGGNAITTTVDTNSDPDNVTVKVGSDTIQVDELDESISPTWTGTHTFNNAIVQNVDPSSDSDVATKSYVDSTDQGLDITESSDVAAERSLDLSLSSDPSPVDGYTLSTGDRVLLKQQNNAVENGIYLADPVSDPSSWARASDAADGDTITNGFFTFVENGTENSSIGYILTNSNSPTVGTDALNFTKFSDAGQTSAGDALTKTGDTISHIDTSSQSNVSSADGSAVTDLDFDEQGHTTSASTTDFDSRYVKGDGDTISGTLNITGKIDASSATEIISATYTTLTDAQNASVSEGSVVYIGDEESLYVKKSSSFKKVPTFDIIKSWVNNNADVPSADVARGFESRTDYPNDPDSGRVVFRTDKT